ncbi:MAG TPA: hypothetical protein VFX53_05040 [Pedococcus sp.]|nr:hypothetical protein [Pedococcus sp.]
MKTTDEEPKREPVPDVPCPSCDQSTLDVEWRLVAKPLGSFSLAGQQMKVSAVETPFLVCPCGLDLQGSKE